MLLKHHSEEHIYIQTCFNSIIYLIELPSISNISSNDFPTLCCCSHQHTIRFVNDFPKGEKEFNFFFFISSSSTTTNSTISSKHQHWSKCSSIIITYSCYWCITCFISLPPRYINTITRCCYLCII
jgi:hypothetical protein